MRRASLNAIRAGLHLMLLLSVAAAAESRGKLGPMHYPAEMNKQFTAPNADVREFVKRFENEGRDVCAKRREVVQALKMRPGDVVADIGAGTGLFSLLFAEQVGPKGIVYAVDISPAFIRHIASQARQRGYESIVKTVLNTQDSTGLPPASVDLAFVCDTYHHFDHPERMLASIHRVLRPGGRLVIIDFDLRPDSGEFVKHRARATKEVYFEEIRAAGFERMETGGAPSLEHNFVAQFRRLERRPESRLAPVTDRTKHEGQ